MVEQMAEKRKWEVEEAARTLVRAEEIKKNKQLYSAALKEIRKQQQAATDVLKMSPEEKIKYGLNIQKGG